MTTGVSPADTMLVLIPAGRPSYGALASGFRTADVVEYGPSATGEPTRVQYDRVVIEHDGADLGEVARQARYAVPRLGPGAGILVPLSGSSSDGAASFVDGASFGNAFAGLRWNGLTRLGERVCAVLAPQSGPADAADLVDRLVLSAAVARLATAAADDADRLARPEASQSDLLARMHASERALLQHLEYWVSVRQPQEPWRTRRLRPLLKKYRAGRLTLRTVRPVISRGRRLRARLVGLIRRPVLVRRCDRCGR